MTTPAPASSPDTISSGNDTTDLFRLAVAVSVGGGLVLIAYGFQLAFVFRLSPVLVAIAVLVFACDPLISSTDPNKGRFAKTARWSAIVFAAAGVVLALVKFGGYDPS